MRGSHKAITNYQLPITNYHLPITNYHFLAAFIKLKESNLSLARPVQIKIWTPIDCLDD